MRTPALQILCILLSFTMGFGNPDFSESLSSVSQVYANRLESASAELISAREAIMQERSPLASEIRRLEEQVIGFETRISQLNTEQAGMETNLGNLEAKRVSLGKNLDYAVSLARELATGMEATLLPGNDATQGDLLQGLKQDLDNPGVAVQHQSTAQAFDMTLKQLQNQLGGSVTEGLAIQTDTMEVRKGQFLHLGPVAYFRDTESGAAGLASLKDGSLMPVAHPLPDWKPDVAAAVFSGKPGYFPADSTGGKAIKLKEAQGSLMDQINKGGLVGYVILALGLLALLTILLKLWDLRKLSVDNPATIKGLIGKLNHENTTPANELFKGLKASCRELFSIALKHRNKPKELLEEILYAFVLLQRNSHEKRLPMLRVIAASAPLLGLLGTVVGMIRTFTLITVLGTGNAAKLSSGISEALITTELGLIVAIPTLIIHGYLSHQTEKRLSLLEQYSIELVNALESVEDESETEEATAK